MRLLFVLPLFAFLACNAATKPRVMPAELPSTDVCDEVICDDLGCVCKPDEVK